MWMRIGEKNLPGQTTQHSAVCWNLFSLRVCAFAAVVECRRCLCTSLSSRSQQQILENSCFWVANGNVIIIIISFVCSREPFHILKSQTCTFHNLYSSQNNLWLWPTIVSHFSIYLYRVLLFSSVFNMHIYLNE